MGMGTRLAVNNALEFSFLAFAAGKAFFLVALSFVFLAQVNIIRLDQTPTAWRRKHRVWSNGCFCYFDTHNYIP